MSFNLAIYGVEFVFYHALESQSSPGNFQTNPTLASGDVTISKDGGSASNLNTTPAATPAGGKRIKVTVSATEMQADDISLVFSDAAGDEWYDSHVHIQPLRLPASTIDDAGGSPSTTAFGTDLTESSDDYYVNQYIYFLSGTNTGLSRKISDYNGTSKQITIAVALPDAPADGDKFLILGRSE